MDGGELHLRRRIYNREPVWEKMNGSRWMEKNYICEDASKIREWTRKNERQSMDEENDFCFGSEKTEDQLRGSVKRK